MRLLKIFKALYTLTFEDWCIVALCFTFCEVMAYQIATGPWDYVGGACFAILFSYMLIDFSEHQDDY